MASNSMHSPSAGRETAPDLPDDVLFRIFWLSKPRYDRWRDGSDSNNEDDAPAPVNRSCWTYGDGTSINFSRVCCRWRRLALASPLLWTSVDLKHTAFAMEILRRAGAAPLEVRWMEETFYDSRSDAPMTLDTSVNVFMDRLPRIRTLQLNFCRTSELKRLIERHNQPAPLLESLGISNVTHSELEDFPYDRFPDEAPKFVPGVDLFLGHAPRLRELFLAGVFINPAWPLFSQLRTLHLRYSMYTPGHVITLDGLLQLLGRMPLLEQLFMEKAVVEPAETFDELNALSHTGVNLHRLRELDVESEATLVTLALLRALSLPPLNRLHIEVYVPDGPVFDRMVARFASLLRPHLDAVAARLSCSHVGLHLQWHSLVAYDRPNVSPGWEWLKINLRLCGGPEPHTALIAAIPLFAPTDSLVHLDVPCKAWDWNMPDDSLLSEAQWATLLAQLPRLQTISARFENGCTVVEALSGPRAHELCPVLHTLTLVAVPLRRPDGTRSLLEALPGLVFARQQIGCPLAVLRLRNVHPLAIEAARVALGVRINQVQFEGIPAADGCGAYPQHQPALEHEAESEDEELLWQGWEDVDPPREKETA